MLAWAYFASGEARAGLGHTDQARADFTHGLDLLAGSLPDRRQTRAREMLAAMSDEASA